VVVLGGRWPLLYEASVQMQNWLPFLGPAVATQRSSASFSDIGLEPAGARGRQAVPPSYRAHCNRWAGCGVWGGKRNI